MAAASAHAAPLTLDVAQGDYELRLQGGSQMTLVGDLNDDGVPDTAERGQDPAGKCEPLAITFRRAPDMGVAGGFEISDSAGSCPGGAPQAWPAGDVNGDGVGDVLLQTSLPEGRGDGRAYVVFGQPDSGPVDLANLGTRGFAIQGSANGSGSPGRKLQVAHGDVNGDGRDDLFIWDADYGEKRPPQVVFGKTTGETVDLSDLGGNGFAVTRKTGVSSISVAPDMNGDGRAELVLSSEGAGTFVVFGRDGTTTAQAGSAPGFRIDIAGFAVGLGDVNGDGRGDLIVDRSVIFGKADGSVVRTRAKQFAGFGIALYDDVCPSSDDPEFPEDIAPAGDVNGDGLADVVANCAVVFGKRDNRPVSMEVPSGHGFAVHDFDEGARNLRALGDVTGDGRGDLLRIGGPTGAVGLIRSPAVLTADEPVPVTATGASTRVLCLARGGCVGDVTLHAAEATTCNGATVAKQELVASGRLQLAPDVLGAVPLSVPDNARRVSTCQLGLLALERVEPASAESFWARESYTELVPKPVPSGRSWAPRSQAFRPPGAIAPSGFDFTFDGSGRAYALVNAGTRKHLQTWLVSPGGRPHALAIRAASMARFDKRHVLVGGVATGPRGAVARYSLMRGRAGAISALDPGHTTADPQYWDPVVVASSGTGDGLAVVRRNTGRNNFDLVARFIGRRAHRRVQRVERGGVDTIGAAVDSHRNAVVAWCNDPNTGYAIARRGGRFGRPHSMGSNEEGECGGLDVAIGPGGRFTIAWVSQALPYNPPNGPVEVRVTTGTIGKRVRSFTLDESPDYAAPPLSQVAVVYSGTHPVVAWTTTDLIAGRWRAIVADLTTHQARWLSPAGMQAQLDDMEASRKSVAATWGPVAGVELPATDAVYATYARDGIDFGAPERIAGAGRGHFFEAPPLVAFPPGSRRPYVAALSYSRKNSRLVFAARPR